MKKKVGKKLLDIGLGNDFLDLTTKAQAIAQGPEDLLAAATLVTKHPSWGPRTGSTSAPVPRKALAQPSQKGIF